MAVLDQRYPLELAATLSLDKTKVPLKQLHVENPETVRRDCGSGARRGGRTLLRTRAWVAARTAAHEAGQARGDREDRDGAENAGTIGEAHGLANANGAGARVC
jgi:hypothetical protein